MDAPDKLAFLVWRKSSFSESGNCVEVAILDDQILVRDSKDRNGPVLTFGVNEWRDFLSSARDGYFDL